MNKTAPSKNDASLLLESLPPIVPSIGFSRGTAAIMQQKMTAVDENRIESSGNISNSILNNSDNKNNNTATTEIRANNTTTNSTNSTTNNTTNNTNTTNNIPPTLKIGNRLILTSKPPRQWSWSSFTSSARRHDNATFSHWVRSNIEYADYPYARFDVHLDPLTYTDEEYALYLEMKEAVLLEEQQRCVMNNDDDDGDGDYSHGEDKGEKKNDKSPAAATTTTSSTATDTAPPNLIAEEYNKLLQNGARSNKILPWTREETDALMELCHAYDLRWPVIIDRWHARFSGCGGSSSMIGGGRAIPIKTTSSLRKVEDLQHRYYQVGSVLAQKRMEAVMAAEVAKLSGVGVASSAVGAGASAGSTAVGVAAGGGGTMRLDAFSSSGGNTAAAAAASSAQTASTSQTQSQQLSAPQTTTTTSNTEPPLHPTEIEGLKATHQLTSIHPSLAPPLSIPGAGIAHRGAKNMFDLATERARRCQLDTVWNRTKEEEREEEELRAELRAVEMQLRKLKKMNKHLVPAGSANAAAAAATALAVGGGAGGIMGIPCGEAVANVGQGSGNTKQHGTSFSTGQSSTDPQTAIANPHPSNPHPIASIDPHYYTNTEDYLDASFNATAPQPTPGTPYLQSGRLFPPAIGGHSGLNKHTLKQMDAILNELGVPSEPIATKRSLDLYDGVRKDALTLLILQKIVLKKEAEVISKKTKLIQLMGESTPTANLISSEKKGGEKRKNARIKGGSESGNAGKVAAGGTAKLSAPGGGPTDVATAAAAGGKKSSGGGNTSSKSSKTTKRPREDSVASASASGQSPAATATSGGKSVGKKAPSTTARKKSRSSKSVTKSTGGDAKTASSAAAPKGLVPVAPGGVPGVPPGNIATVSQPASTVPSSMLPGTILPAVPSIHPVQTVTSDIPSAKTMIPPRTDTSTMASPYPVPSVSTTTTTTSGKSVGKAVRPPGKSLPLNAGAGGIAATPAPTASTMTMSPGKTTKKKRQK